MNFNGLPTTVGSLPYTNPQEGISLIFKFTPEIPAWPQLPKRSFKENMYAQYSENFPGIIIDDETKKIFVNLEIAVSELEKFYKHYLSNDIDYFVISEDYAAGFYHLINHLISKSSNIKISALKCHTTGPITFGLAIKTESGQSIFYDSQLRDAVIKHIIMKSLWQLKQLMTYPRLSTQELPLTTYILFLDEPYLAAYGSPFTAISQEDIVSSLQEVIYGIKNSLHLITQSPNNLITLYIGAHCCANSDWSILLDTDIDILSFDAYEFFDNLILYQDKLKNFIYRGGVLAWGIVPTTESALKSERVDTLNNRLNNYLGRLKEKGIQEDKLKTQMLLTPACGLGSCSVEAAELVLEYLSELSNRRLRD